MEELILVDENDREIGTAEKLVAHRNGGQLHRAFSVFLFDRQGRLLLQQRAVGKYHFPLLWTNACCSHPRPGETVLEAAHRRLGEELGVDAELQTVFAFVYSAEDAESGLTEREYDHVLVGRLDTDPTPNPDEVEAVRWVAPADLFSDVEASPQRYTPWFREAIAQLQARDALPGASDRAAQPRRSL